MSDRRTAVLLLLAAALGVTLRLAPIVENRPLGIDEPGSFLCAAGHYSELMRARSEDKAPAGRWVRASEWKRFLLPDDFFTFRQTASDLARYEANLPLYCWLLHVWTFVAGTGVAQGLALNLLIDLVLGTVLFFFARRILRSGPAAACVVLLWATSPAALRTFDRIRPYDLFALWAVLSGYAVLSVADPLRRGTARQLALLAAATAMGLLIQPLVLFPIAASTVWLAVVLRRERRTLVLAMAAVVAGACAFLVLHPDASTFLARLAGDRPPNEGGGFVERAVRIGAAIGSFAVDPRVAGIGGRALRLPVSLALAAIALAGLAALATRIVRHRAVVAWGRDEAFAPFMFTAIIAAVGVAYLMGIIPLHAMDAQYLSACWPYLAVTVVVLLRPLRSGALPVVLSLAALLVLSSAALLGLESRFPEAHERVPVKLLTGRPLIYDNVGHRMLRDVWGLNDDTLVFASSQENLIRDAKERLPLIGGEILYLSPGEDGSPSRDRILSILALRNRVDPVAQENNHWRLFRLTPIEQPKTDPKP